MALTGGQRMDINHRLFLLKGNVSQLATVRRPGRRNDRLGRGQCRRRALAVRIGNLQQELTAGFDDISNPGRENTLFTGQLFINKVGNSVPGRTQLFVASHVSRAAERNPFLRVVKPETGFHPAIRATADTAGSQRISALPLPVGMRNRRIFIERGATGINQLEQTTALQIGADGCRNDAGGRRVAGQIGNRHRNPVSPSPGDFDGKLGLSQSCGQQEKSEKNTARNSLHGVHFQ